MNRNILTINRKQFITVPLLPYLFEYKLFFYKVNILCINIFLQTNFDYR